MADEVRRAFGLAIAVARQRRGLSQRQLADQAQVGRARMSRIETGGGDATIEVQYRIALALGMTTYQLWEMAKIEDRVARREGVEEGPARDE